MGSKAEDNLPHDQCVRRREPRDQGGHRFLSLESSVIIFWSQVEKDSLFFKGNGGADKAAFELNMKFLKEVRGGKRTDFFNFSFQVDPEATKYQVRPRCIEFALEKAEEGPYWERLLAEKTKQHWLKVCSAFDLLLTFLNLQVDFGKWKDEDDSDAEGEGGAGGGDLEEMMKNMGGLGGGMGGMGGMGGNSS